jgi:hypothetical protein
MKRALAIVLLGLLVVAGGCASEPAPETEETAEVAAGPDYEALGLETDASISSIDQELILAGGPPKDGIPALTDPEFVAIADSDLNPGSEGILIEIDGEQRFYPYAILVWHEVVNDHVGQTPVTVTF